MQKSTSARLCSYLDPVSVCLSLISSQPELPSVATVLPPRADCSSLCSAKLLSLCCCCCCCCCCCTPSGEGRSSLLLPPRLFVFPKQSCRLISVAVLHLPVSSTKPCSLPSARARGMLQFMLSLLLPLPLLIARPCSLEASPPWCLVMVWVPA